MRKPKNSLVVFVVVLTLIITAINYIKKSTYTMKTQETPVKVTVFLLDFTDDFISLIGENLETIEKQHPGQVQYTFYDGKSDQRVQDEQINKVLDEGIDLILLNIVNRGSAPAVINKFKERNIPVILFNREPLTPIPLQAYDKAIYIGTDAKEAGILQGRMLVDAWKTSKFYIDRNNDNIMQYVMLQGESDSTEAILRTKHSISAIENAGIATQLVAIEICNWREDLAYNAINKLFSEYGDQIEVIIANDDAMAIGAIKSLQEHGFNKGTISTTIPVVGIDLTPDARELIDEGYMLGSVLQDPRAYAEALYTVGMNLVHRRNPLTGTNYEFDETRVAILLPHTNFLYRNIFLEF